MHSIRLRKPWTKHCGDQSQSRVDVPDRTPSDEDRWGDQASVCYERAFNRPTGLDERTSVLLVIESWRGLLRSVSLGDQPLELPLETGCQSGPVTQPIRREITSLLGNHNHLKIFLDSDLSERPLLDGEVRLEIESDERD